MTRDPESAALLGAMPTALGGHVFQQPMPTAAGGHGTPTADRVAVAAAKVVTGDMATVTRLRAAPGPGANPPASLLRHADEQAVLAVSAVLHAAADVPHLGPFADWAVVASPCELGRFGCGNVIEKFHIDGVRGVAPHAIPNLSLHAAAATVSIALCARGASFGTGGGLGHVADGLFAGLWLQLTSGGPGTWAVFSDWDGNRTNGVGQAVALALAADGTPGAPWSLSLRQGPPPATWGPVKLSGLVEFLTSRPGPRWDCPLDGGGELVLAEEAA
jgi:hypothetical protein